MQVLDMKTTILQIKKVITKKNLMNNLEEKCETINLAITRFMVKYTNLRHKGLLDIHVFNEKLMPQKDYYKKFMDFAKEQVNKQLAQGTPTGKVLLQYFEDLFFLQNEIKHLFVIKPTFARYTEADENFRKMKNVQIPKAEEWQNFIDLM